MSFIALAILWASAAYLLILGVTAIVKPRLAHQFLAGFAQTAQVNWIEAIIRFSVGAAMAIAAPQLPYQTFFRLLGGFLMVTALAMPLLADRHRQFATTSVAAVAPYMRLVGLASLAGGIGLGFILSAALE